MENKLIIVDGFYPNPEWVVDIANRARFSRAGLYSHFERTASFFPCDVIEVFERLIDARIVLDESWAAPRVSVNVNETTFNGTFYRVPEGAIPPTHIHHDGRDWAGIVYLSENAPPQDGTSFYRHRETGLAETIYPAPDLGDVSTRKDGADLTKWAQTHFVANKFNRLILYGGRHYHSACIDEPQNRLCQLFTFNVDDR